MLHVAAAILWRGSAEPSVEAVMGLAREMRQELWANAFWVTHQKLLTKPQKKLGEIIMIIIDAMIIMLAIIILTILSL